MATIDVNGTEIRYRLHGAPTTRPLVVLLHGAAGGQYVWLEQRHLPHVQILTLDLPGHGGSAPLPTVTIPAYADVVAQCTAQLGFERFVAVGHSMGGAIALTLALDHPARVAGLGLLATGAKLPVSDLVFAALEMDLDQLGEILAQVAYAPQTDRGLVARFTAGPLQVTAAVARADFAACADFDVRTRLAEISVPTLIVAGTEDQLVGAGRTHQLAGGIADSQLELVPDAGHMVMQEQPARVNAALGALLDRVDPPA